MRSRKEIESEIGKVSKAFVIDHLTVELLLDIRDLLSRFSVKEEKKDEL